MTKPKRKRNPPLPGPKRVAVDARAMLELESMATFSPPSADRLLAAASLLTEVGAERPVHRSILDARADDLRQLADTLRKWRDKLFGIVDSLNPKEIPDSRPPRIRCRFCDRDLSDPRGHDKEVDHTDHCGG